LASTTCRPSPTGLKRARYSRDNTGKLAPILYVDPSASRAAGALTSDVPDIVQVGRRTNIAVTAYVVDGLWRQILDAGWTPGSPFRPEC
jgi:hypothetical protein